MFFINKQKKGIVLYFTLTILSVLTASLLATVIVIVSQTRIISVVGDSIAAFYIADAGAEDALYRIYNQGESPNNWGLDYCFPTETISGGGGEYQVCVSDTVTSKIWSEGIYFKSSIKRKIELEVNF